ncbi:U-scoloptoxin(05)-Sm1a isoform X3 [Cydia pomonella]|uniref:U-scoloptoxin(05)-Sm1a isoform X3 n=1 Tax=Cydia pomonella TaxID=82600 RepID=UPI002ADE9206|nr:U-scoloptoxin(05)-Sm1a isoform X3 [Cydia pomonella]
MMQLYKSVLFMYLTFTSLKTVVAIDCYQCNSSTTMECGDVLMHLDGGSLKPTSCEHVFNAQFCIKHTGGISTKRYCSSLDLGNYCNYVQQPGDKLEYRTCIYTCSSDGCNAATGLAMSSAVTFLIVVHILGCVIIRC